jgi:plastocyanin
MLRSRIRLSLSLAAVAALAALLPWFGAFAAPSPDAARPPLVRVTIPHEDRFTPFAMTIHAGQTVDWVNTDTDDHTVVSDDAFNTAGHRGVDHLLPGTDSNGGRSGIYFLRFTQPGTFVYYCRFHATLDSANQPMAPGPDGGIQDANGNFGTPMMGVITVLPAGD